jgi:hypothetical protein
MRRAAELLEWLSHPRLEPDGIPVRLLAAAAYQLAGYPARAAGLLRFSENARGGPLSALLRGDFPQLLNLLADYWSANARAAAATPEIEWESEEETTADLRKLVELETSSALGVLCAAMRWGGADRVQLAIEKLIAVSEVMLNSQDRFSWLFAKLVAETAQTFISNSLRTAVQWLPERLGEDGDIAVERYSRQAYQSCKTQAWPSQARGIARLAVNDSFVLCTPTGSGKTTVAEIAILQSLFSGQLLPGAAPLVMYLVPSRALAAEVEAKLSRVIGPLSRDEIVITGLYGGIDWGPSDAWLTSDNRTVLICTYEKAEALIRFLGPLFLLRLLLVVLDEAHMIQFSGSEESLRTAENRSLRLESLMARLVVHIPADSSRIIALSAVAAGMEGTLARWITGNDAAVAERTLYRSTRQLIGRLECRPSRDFQIRYDLLDRVDLRFDDSDATPFVPQPFPAYPPAASFENAGVEKRLRPYLFWAAMHLVAPSGTTERHAVLVSIPQQIGGYAQDLLDLLEGAWASEDKPDIFQEPTDPTKLDRWQRCLNACEDYFGTGSREYRLLRKGIVTHHGKMPGLMARLLVQLVDEGVVHLILATSTLSEGINLPFETVLLPTLRRSNQTLTTREFANLAGRAGRPGHGTEGRCLVLLPASARDYGERMALRRYESIVEELRISDTNAPAQEGGRSALATLLRHLFAQWSTIAGTANEGQFLAWLEQTAVLQSNNPTGQTDSLTESLDSLDSILLAAIVELESFAGAAFSETDLEARLVEIWQRCYAHYADAMEQQLARWFTTRGKALASNIYPDPAARKRLYRTGLPPRLGDLLTTLYAEFRDHVLLGNDYAAWDADQRFEFIRRLVEILGQHPRFSLATRTPRNVAWERILRWWLDSNGPISRPTATQVSDWYDYVAQNFTYRFTWGVGCILALAADVAHPGELRASTLESWSDTGLPWIALWLKELITWGTLDPVAAYLLGRSRAGTRVEAQQLAAQYYQAFPDLSANELIDPRAIRRWVDSLPVAARVSRRYTPSTPIRARLTRQFPAGAARRWRVLPVEMEGNLGWLDPAGFLMATSDRPSAWRSELLEEGDFWLDVESEGVAYTPYL